MKYFAAIAGASLMASASASRIVQYRPKVKGISLTDVAQDASLKTVFTTKPFSVEVELEWVELAEPIESTGVTASANIQGQDFDLSFPLYANNYTLPGSLEVPGTFEYEESGTATISATVLLNGLEADKNDAADSDDDNESTDEKTLQVIGSGVSLIPLITVFVLAVVTRRVEVALFAGVWVGAFILSGLDIAAGFKSALVDYILTVLTDLYKQYVIVFTLFLSGLVGMMEKSGGMFGMTKNLARLASGPRSAQFLSWVSGFLLFFDDYANCLVVGATMRPITDLMHVSREKLAFIVDATAAPIAAVMPISSWVAYESGLIDDELKNIVKFAGAQPEGLAETGFQTYLRSMPWRYYPFLMMAFQFIIIALGREFGPMLVAERKCRIQERTDGGDGATLSRELKQHNKPSAGTPERAWNMLVPLGFLVAFILHEMIKGGKISEEGEGDFIDWFQSGDSYNGLLFGTMGASFVTLLFYAIQFRADGSITFPVNPKAYITFKKETVLGSDEDEEKEEAAIPEPRPLLYFSESIDAWLHGMLQIFPAIIVLVLAWSAAAIMQDIGADRLFAESVAGEIDPNTLPALTFVLSFFIALCTGTSWGTMAIMIALVLVPSYKAIVGVEGRSALVPTDEGIQLFYGVEAAILSGAVAGDHSSLISDTSVLSATATQCDLTKHVVTQISYVLFVCFFSLIIGYLPAGFGAWGAGVGIFLGILVMIPAAYALGAPILPASGRFDPLTELYMKCNKKSELHELKEATLEYVAANPEKAMSEIPCKRGAEQVSVSSTLDNKEEP